MEGHLTMYTGHVYNYEGTPLSGIKVTDGLNVSITDESGAYELCGWERANVISEGTLTLYHDDWFRYIDKGHFYSFSTKNLGPARLFLFPFFIPYLLYP